MRLLFWLLGVPVLGALIFLSFRPIPIELAKIIPFHDAKQYHAGDTVCPLRNFNFDKGNWKVYLIISIDDLNNLSDKMPSGTLFTCSNVAIMKQMQKEWKFIYNGEADMATVESYIIFCHNGVNVFESGIVIDKNGEGMQGPYGWMSTAKKEMLVKQCSKFSRSFMPFVLVH